ncbi:phosphoglycolate phosphatase [Paracoccus sp. JM45]|nr:phosphoglycolate phosphatase [Paracoccus sp. JM45]
MHHASRPIVFDLDGTLIDSAPDIHACANKVLDQNNLTILSLPQVRSFIGGGVELLWSRIIAALGIDAEKRPDLIDAFMAHYHQATELTALFPGVIDALNRLADDGHPLGLCTNKPMQPTKAALAHFGLDVFMSTIVAGDTLPQMKPDPAPLRFALQQMGVTGYQQRALYIGDSEFDAYCAAAVPVPFLIYSGGYRNTAVSDLPHLHAFDHFNELPALVRASVSPDI